MKRIDQFVLVPPPYPQQSDYRHDGPFTIGLFCTFSICIFVAIGRPETVTNGTKGKSDEGLVAIVLSPVGEEEEIRVETRRIQEKIATRKISQAVYRFAERLKITTRRPCVH